MEKVTAVQEGTRQKTPALSPHGLMLVYLARHPFSRQVDISRAVRMDLRTVACVIVELKRAGLLRVKKDGRRNSYEVVTEANLQEPSLTDCTVGDLLSGLVR